MEKILITGGAGNIGSSLAAKLLSMDKYFVVIVDNLSTGSKSKLPSAEQKNYEFFNCDVNNYSSISQIMLSNKFDYVFHFAALVGVLRTLQNPIKVFDDINGIKNILELSKNTGVKRTFFSSSSEVYGEPVSLPQNEDRTPLNSKLPYAIVKNLGESYFKSYYEYFGLNYTIFRFFNTYGPNQSEDFVIPKLLHKAIKHEDLTIYGDGNQSRTFCFIDDNIDTCTMILEKGYYINDTVNIGDDNVFTINDLVEIIIEITGSKSKIINLPPLPNGDMSRRQPDITKMKKILKRDLISLRSGIFKMYEIYKQNER